MKRKPLDEMLDKLGSEPVPDAPGNVESRVMREIRVPAPRERSGEGVLGMAWISQLRIVSAAMVVAVGFGLISGAVISPDTPAPGDKFTFEAFSPALVELDLNRPRR